jgi:FAD:protein FMN transferase
MSTPTYTWPHRRLRAMGCEMAIWLDVDTATAEAILPTAAQMFHEAEARLSRFRPTSELMQLNQRAGEWVAVSAELWGVVQEALHWAAVTEGLFDPTQLNALVGLGYDRSFEQLPVQSMAVPPAPRASQWAAVEMNPDGRAIRLPATVQLDLGGIAKGYTAQQVADFLRPWGPALVNAGGDVTATAAPQGGRAGPWGWPNRWAWARPKMCPTRFGWWRRRWRLRARITAAGNTTAARFTTSLTRARARPPKPIC